MSGKRALDLAVATVGIAVALPMLVLIAVSVWLGDRRAPVFAGPRTGQHGKSFKMLKFRTMVVDAATFGGSSTSAKDTRITKAGHLLRPLKLDELPQLFNVLRGDMSLVGPRPNVLWATETYSALERNLLLVRPGITDLASIVFSDEGEILALSIDPELDYERIVRPYKSALGLLYVHKVSLGLNIRILALTALNLVSRERTLAKVADLVVRLGGSTELANVCLRNSFLTPSAPPGWTGPVTFVGEIPRSSDG